MRYVKIMIAMLLMSLLAPIFPATAAQMETATFAGGCFWCMEAPFDKLDGVASVTVGYIGGTVKNPTYEQVSSGSTGHAEAVQITYDPSRISYTRLLGIFWHNIDPTVKNKQFCDTGNQYRAAIFYHDDKQRTAALASKTALERDKPFRKPVLTEIVPAGIFYPAEEYHQQYYKKNPLRYKYYRTSCGRDRRLKELWGDQVGRSSGEINKIILNYCFFDMMPAWQECQNAFFCSSASGC